MCRAARMYLIAASDSASGQRMRFSGASSPAATRSITRRRAAPGIAGSSSFRISTMRMEYDTSGRAAAISSSV